MARFTQLAILLPFLFTLFDIVRSSPVIDEGMRRSLEGRDSELRPLHLARRDASGYKPRHLRPEEIILSKKDSTLSKRDSITPPDVGQLPNFDGDPQPIRNGAGASFLGPSNHLLDKQNLDNVAGPTSDAGTVANLKWSMSLSHTKLLKGGWVREQTITDLPPSKDVAAAELRLAPNAYRELHWHKIAEWGYILGGNGRISVIDQDGKTYQSDIKGPTNTSDPDIYYFPPGTPHSIQALDEGLEILLIFTDGDFDTLGTTFMLSDWLARTPIEIVAQNFGLTPDDLKNVPQKFPYIFPSTVPPPGFGQGVEVPNPNGNTKLPFVFHLDKQEKQMGSSGGGWVKIQDSVTNFAISKDLASALVFVEPNGMREMHWHIDDEWLYIISGSGRATAFAGSSSSRTFDFQPGDTAVWPKGYGHYMKNTSPTEPLIYLEIFKTDKYIDYSATQWLALMPPQAVSDLLGIPVEKIQKFKKEKQLFVA